MTKFPCDARELDPTDGEHAGKPGILHDRFLINGSEPDGRFAAVEHLLPPKTIAAPLHRQHHEDEYSFVLEGRVGAWLGGEEVFATARMLIFKQAFRDLDALGGGLTPEAVAVVGARYPVDIDFEGTGPIAERHGLAM